MILVSAVLAGLLAGLLRSRLGNRKINVPTLRLVWLVPLAYIPQLLTFHLPVTRECIPDDLAAIFLITSQGLLLAFAWSNRRQPGFWLLGSGLLLNFTVITLNGGLMPISPEVVTQLIPSAHPGAWTVGNRLGKGKDIVLPHVETRLYWFSDKFLLPAWFPWRVAFSLGDVLIAIGVFWFLWAQGAQSQPDPESRKSICAHK